LTLFHLRACYEQHASSCDGEPTPPILCKIQGCQNGLRCPSPGTYASACDHDVIRRPISGV